MRALLVSLVMLLCMGAVACGGEDAVTVSQVSESALTEEELTEEDDAEEPQDDDFVVTGVDVDLFCPSLDRITTTVVDAEALAFTPGQLDAQADLEIDTAVVLEEIGDRHGALGAALALISEDGQLFGTGEDLGFTAEEIADAGQLAIQYWNTNCADYAGAGGDVPDQEEDQPDPSAFGADGQEDEYEDYDAECPSPETLEANGYECDEFGNLTPVEGQEPDPNAFGADGQEDEYEDYDAECPSPEVLEAEGLECDEFGNTYPAGEYSDGHGDGEEYDPEAEEGYDPDFGGDGQED